MVVRTHRWIPLLVQRYEGRLHPVLGHFLVAHTHRMILCKALTTVPSSSFRSSTGISSGPAAFPSLMDLGAFSTSSSRGAGSFCPDLPSCCTFSVSENRASQYSRHRSSTSYFSVRVVPSLSFITLTFRQTFLISLLTVSYKSFNLFILSCSSMS